MALEYEIDIDADASSADKAADSVANLSKQMKGIGGQTDQLSSSMGSLGDQAKGAGQGMGSLGETANGASSDVSSLNEELGAATEGLSYVVEAVLAATAAFGAMLVEVAGVTQDLKLMHDQIDAVSNGAGQQMNDMVDELAKKLPETKEQIAKTTVQLEQMGYTGDQVYDALMAMSSANAVAAGSGDALVNTLRKVSAGGKLTAKDLKAIGVTPEELATSLGMNPKQLAAQLKQGVPVTKEAMVKLEEIVTKKGAQPLADKMQSLGTMWQKFKESIADLFDGIANSPGFRQFLAAVQSFFTLFSAQSEGMKSGMTSAFSAMFAVASRVLIWMQIAILKVATYGLKAYVWVYPFIKQLKLWAISIGFVDKFIVGLKIIGVLLAVLISPFVLLNAIALATAAAIVAVGAAIIYAAGWIYDHFVPVLKTLGVILLTVVGGPIAAVIGAWFLFSGVIKKVVGWIGDLVKKTVGKLGEWVDSAKDAAANFVAGLTGGLAEGTDAVAGASKKLGDAASKALSDSMKMHSPSLVMKEHGKNMGAGLAIGMDESQSDVHASASGMSAAASGGVGVGSSGGGGGVTINIESGAVQIVGAGSNGQELVDLLEEALARTLERVAIEQGFLQPQT
jgi:hypothetical protein